MKKSTKKLINSISKLIESLDSQYYSGSNCEHTYDEDIIRAINNLTIAVERLKR